MAFRGFLVESKSFMSYDNRSMFGKMQFWFEYPFAYVRFLMAGRR